MHEQRPILCPNDVSGDGYVYGWLSPLISITDIIRVDTLADAKARLRQLQRSSDWTSLVESCGAFPTVIGRASSLPRGSTKDERLPSSALQLLSPDGSIVRNSTTTYTFVRYARPRLRHLEMYTLDASLSSALGLSRMNHEIPYTHRRDICLLDFTRPSVERTSLFDQTVINQMNVGQAMSQAYAGSYGKCASQNTAGNVEWSFDGKMRGRFVGMSALALQVNTRIRQLHYLYTKFPPPSYQRCSMSTEVITNFVGFYNCLWLILNDIIIGIAFGSLILENAALLSNILRQWIQGYLIQDIQQTLLWLNSWPAGLKLNTELSVLYYHSLTGVMVMWNYLLTALVLPQILNLVHVSGVIGLCGATMVVALLADILSLATFHVQLCYTVSLTIFTIQTNVIGKLSKLFHGKRHNVLRQRTDSWLFDVDQLLFGTVMFTLLAFIFPTVLVYYTFFALLHLCILIVNDILRFFLTLINKYPLFALMLHIKDPFRLPDGTVLDISSDGRSYYLLFPCKIFLFTTSYKHSVSISLQMTNLSNKRCLLKARGLK